MSGGRKVAVVTGATGFIGRRLCARLKEGDWRVIAVGRRTAEGPWEQFVEHEFGAGQPLVLPGQPEVVFHLASRVHALADTSTQNEAYFRVNAGGMEELLRALGTEAETRVVLTSSVKAHGEETGPEGVEEADVSAPTTAYGQSKAAAERLLLESPLGARAVVLRLAMVFGPGNKGNLAEMIAAIAKNRFPPIPDNGNRRSMVHVDDVVDALISAASSPTAGGRMFYVAGPRTWSSRDLYVAILTALGRSVPRWHVPLSALRILAGAGDVIGTLRGRRFVWDSDKFGKLFSSAHYRGDLAARVFGFRARRDLQDALPGMIEEALGSA